jgi:hypothetical protein
MCVQWLVSGAALLPSVRAGGPKRHLGVIADRSASASAKHLNPGAAARLLALLKWGPEPVGVRSSALSALVPGTGLTGNAMECKDIGHFRSDSESAACTVSSTASHARISCCCLRWLCAAPAIPTGWCSRPLLWHFGELRRRQPHHALQRAAAPLPQRRRHSHLPFLTWGLHGGT